MIKLLLKTPQVLIFFGVFVSSIELLSATPANGLTFKGTIYESPVPDLENSQVQYTLADGIFDTIVSSPLNTFFTDGYSDFNDDPTRSITVVPEVVTEFKWIRARDSELVDFEPSFKQSIFGITAQGLSLYILNPDLDHYQNIFISTIQAPEGLPLSACKTQACDASAKFWNVGYYSFGITQTPLNEPEPVPEPSAAVALGFVGVLFIKRRRKTLSAQPIPILNQE